MKRKVIVMARRDRRTASDSAAATGDEFEGYAVELLAEVAKLLRISFKLYAVPLHGSSSVRGRTQEYGMWSSLVDQLLTEASSYCSRRFMLISLLFIARQHTAADARY